MTRVRSLLFATIGRLYATLHEVTSFAISPSVAPTRAALAAVLYLEINVTTLVLLIWRPHHGSGPRQLATVDLIIILVGFSLVAAITWLGTSTVKRVFAPAVLQREREAADQRFWRRFVTALYVATTLVAFIASIAAS